MAEITEYSDYKQWLDAAIEAGYKIEADDKDDHLRHALTDGRDDRGSYNTAANKGRLEGVAQKRTEPRTDVAAAPAAPANNDGEMLRNNQKAAMAANP